MTVVVTAVQNEYLLLLDEGISYSKRFSERQGVCISTVHKVLKALQAKGLVTVEQEKRVGNYLKYTIIAPYKTLVDKNIIVVDHTENCGNGDRITDQELQCVADLRKRGHTGTTLIDKFLEKYPARSAGSVKNIVLKARRRGFCR